MQTHVNATRRPALFYLFPKGDDIKIRRMTDAEARELRQQGQSWLDIPKMTFSEAKQVRLLYIAKRRQNRP